MSGGWKDSDRRARLPTDWPARRTAVHKRSGWKCEVLVIKHAGGLPQRCGRYADGGVDHIINDDDDSLSNLRDTCSTHHRSKSSQEGNAAKAARRALIKRPKPPERHPGEIRRTPCPPSSRP
jgi:5-methylcytosine-specific restriction protein A